MRALSFVTLISLLACAAAQDLFLASKSDERLQASTADLARARTRSHTGVVSGRSTTEIAEKINKHLARSSQLRECNSFPHEELNNMVRKMWKTFSPELQKAYANSNKDLRLRREASLDDFEKRWLKEDSGFMKNFDSSEALREAKCAEVLMLWVHHVPQPAKDALKAMVLPKLPEFNFERLKHKNPSLSSRYASSFTCVTGHNMQSTHTSDHKWPHWPAELHYHGKGHGAYPFWVGGESPAGDGALEVWWSEKQQAEKFYHHSCAMSEAGASKDQPCYHLMKGGQPNPTAYLYTASEDFCCISGPSSAFQTSGRRLQSGNAEKLAPPASDFMDNMTDSGEMDFKGDFYNGKVKKYLMQLPDSEAVTWFWYLTTPEGIPVEQGEGGKPSSDDKPTQPGRGILLWHEYNQSTFDTAAIDPSVFAVPQVCQKTYTSCTFP